MLVGLVGKPSAGKSTFFKAATLAEVAIASYPFTTIKPTSALGIPSPANTSTSRVGDFKSSSTQGGCPGM